MMSAELIKDITNGFHNIDLERDEILIRHEQCWDLPTDYNELNLTENLRTQIDIGLPLSSIQVNRIEKMFQHELFQVRRQRERDRIAQLRTRQSTFVNSSNVSSYSHSRTETITYEEVIARHLTNLKQIREYEHRITYPVMLDKWDSVQDMIMDLKRGEDINYSKFLSQMFELLYYLDLY